jgi:hypothetical protein
LKKSIREDISVIQKLPLKVQLLIALLCFFELNSNDASFAIDWLMADERLS